MGHPWAPPPPLHTACPPLALRGAVRQGRGQAQANTEAGGARAWVMPALCGYPRGPGPQPPAQFHSGAGARCRLFAVRSGHGTVALDGHDHEGRRAAV